MILNLHKYEKSVTATEESRSKEVCTEEKKGFVAKMRRNVKEGLWCQSWKSITMIEA